MRAKFRILMLAPLTALTILSSGCDPMLQSEPPQTTEIPSFPKPKPEVAEELRSVCIAKDTKQNYCPATFEWLGRLHKLESKMEVLQ